jgi:enolase
MKASHQKIPHPHQLERGWVIANHILVSFHVAFISSVLCIPLDASDKGDVLRFIFRSPETIVSVLFWYATWHAGIAVHEMGHYLKAVDLDSLKRSLLPEAQKLKRAPLATKLAWYARMFLTIPGGGFNGVRKQGLTYYPDAPYNLAVAAAGPRASRNLAWAALPPAVVLVAWGLVSADHAPIYAGRLLLGIGAVGLLDFFLADPGQYKTFKHRERAARARSAVVQATAAKETHRWIDMVADVKRRMIDTRMQETTLPDGTPLKAPWGFRNSGMGGRHTEKEFPESNISMQETMFIPLSARNYEDAQRMTVELQTRFKEIIENAEGARVLGVGLEGGLAAYVIKKPEDIVPEQRLWRMAHQAIMDCGYTPGTDVVLALDPAASELENAYREKFEQPDQIGMYLFWRDEAHVAMNREELFDLYRKTLEDDGIPIVSIEDGFAEDDDQGWRLLMDRLSDKIFIIGDDSVTTKDSSIEFAADAELNNCTLIKANQIGTLSECLIAMLVALGKGSELVVSHRSKSPNDDMEAQIALAANAVGLKAGGGANTERLVKYGSVMKTMKDAIRRQAGAAGRPARSNELDDTVREFVDRLAVTGIVAYEEATNAGIPSVGVEVCVGIPGDRVYERMLRFTGATPLGTSAGTGEAIHLVDSIIPRGSVVERHPDCFELQPDGSYRFTKASAKCLSRDHDAELSAVWQKAKRYGGKGCLTAVDNVEKIIAPAFLGRRVVEIGSVADIDRALLRLELGLARERGLAGKGTAPEDEIAIMQRKGQLGMNAVLSMSLALARLRAAVEGKHLWQVLREEMTRSIARVLAAHGIDARDEEPLSELARKLRALSPRLKEKDVKLTGLFRDAIPVYRPLENGSKAGLPGDTLSR